MIRGLHIVCRALFAVGIVVFTLTAVTTFPMIVPADSLAGVPPLMERVWDALMMGVFCACGLVLSFTSRAYPRFAVGGLSMCVLLASRGTYAAFPLMAGGAFLLVMWADSLQFRQQRMLTTLLLPAFILLPILLQMTQVHYQRAYLMRPFRDLQQSTDSSTAFGGGPFAPWSTGSAIDPDFSPRVSCPTNGLVAHSESGEVSVGRIGESTSRPLGLDQEPRTIDEIVFSPDGRYLAVSDSSFPHGKPMNQTWLWRLDPGEPTGAPVLTPLPSISLPDDVIHATTIAPDNATLLVSYRSHGLRYWDIATGRLIRQEPRSPYSVAVSPDQSLLALCDTSEIVVRDYDRGTVRARFRPEDRYSYTSRIVFSQDGKYVFADYLHTRAVWMLDPPRWPFYLLATISATILLSLTATAGWKHAPSDPPDSTASPT